MPPLKAPDRAERDFRFVIRDGDRPDGPQPDSQEVYVVRRAKRPGYVTVKLPGGDTKDDTKKDVMIDGTGLKIAEELGSWSPMPPGGEAGRAAAGQRHRYRPPPPPSIPASPIPGSTDRPTTNQVGES